MALPKPQLNGDVLAYDEIQSVEIDALGTKLDKLPPELSVFGIKKIAIFGFQMRVGASKSSHVLDLTYLGLTSTSYQVYIQPTYGSVELPINVSPSDRTLTSVTINAIRPGFPTVNDVGIFVLVVSN